jgi:hypothetical protein
MKEYGVLQGMIKKQLTRLIYIFIGLAISACQSTTDKRINTNITTNVVNCLPTQKVNDDFFQASSFGINLPAAKLAVQEELASQVSTEISNEIIIKEANKSGKVDVLFQSNTVMASKKVPLDGFTFTGTCQGKGYAQASAQLAKDTLVKNLSLKLPTLWQEVDMLEKNFKQLTSFQRIGEKDTINEMLSDLLRIDELKKQYAKPLKNTHAEQPSKRNNTSDYYSAFKNYLFKPDTQRVGPQQLAINKLLTMKAQTHLVLNFSGLPRYALLTDNLKQSLTDIGLAYQEHAKKPTAIMNLSVNEQINKHGNNNIVILDARFQIKLTDSDKMLTDLSLGRAIGNSSLSVKAATQRAQYQLLALVSKKINSEQYNIKTNLGIKD